MAYNEYRIKSVAKYDDNSIIVSVGDNPEDKYVACLGDINKVYDKDKGEFKSALFCPSRMIINNEISCILVIRCPHCGQVIKLICGTQKRAPGPLNQLESSFINGEATYFCPDCNKDFIPLFDDRYDFTKLISPYSVPDIIFHGMPKIKKNKIVVPIGKLFVENVKNNLVSLQTQEVDITKRSINTKGHYYTSDCSNMSDDVFMRMFFGDIIQLFPDLSWFTETALFQDLLKIGNYIQVLTSFIIFYKNVFTILENFPEDYEFILSSDNLGKYIWISNTKELITSISLFLSKPKGVIAQLNDILSKSKSFYHYNKDIGSDMNVDRFMTLIDIATVLPSIQEDDLVYLNKRFIHLLNKKNNKENKRMFLFILDNFNNDFASLKTAIGKSYISANKLNEIYVFLKAYQKQFKKKCSVDDYVKIFRKDKTQKFNILQNEYAEYFKNAPSVKVKLSSGRTLIIKMKDAFTELHPLVVLTIKAILDNNIAFLVDYSCEVVLLENDGSVIATYPVNYYSYDSCGLVFNISLQNLFAEYNVSKIWINMFNEKVKQFKNEKDLLMLSL